MPSSGGDSDDDDDDDDEDEAEERTRKRTREEVEEEEEEGMPSVESILITDNVPIEEEQEEAEELQLPITHEAELKGHLKPVSALAVDPSGARLLTGGFDYIVKFWDFGGMDASMRSFREIEPCGGHQVLNINTFRHA